MPRTYRKKAKPHLWFYDYETTGWEHTRLCVVQRDDGEESVFWGTGAAAQVAALAQREGGTWIAHAGGIFDHLLTWRDGSWPAEVVLTGSSVLKARSAPASHRPALYWRDSYPRWQSPLAKVGKAVGLPKLDVDRGRIDDVRDEELLPYCRRDTEIVRAGWLAEDAWLARHGVTANTSGSAAVKLLAVLDPDTWWCLQRHQVDPEVAASIVLPSSISDDKAREAAALADEERAAPLSVKRGGRTETRRIGRVAGPVHVYDLHSSYPSQFGKAEVPVGCEPTDSRDLSAWGWFDLVEWEQPPLRDDRTAFELGRNGRGVGRLQAWLTWEVAQALDKRGLRPRRAGIGYRPTGACPRFGSEFVRTLYALKEGGGVESFFAKVTLNSLHGKLGERFDRFRHVLRKDAPETLTAEQGWLERYEPDEVWVRPSPHQQVLAEQAIVQRARLTLACAIEVLEAAGFHFYYADTDSLHTDCPPEQFKWLLPLGPGLGYWGHEGTFAEAWYLAPKTYFLVTDTQQRRGKFAAKGQNKEALTLAHYQQAAAGERVVIDREGLGKFRSGASAGHLVSLPRTLAPVHAGRERRADGVLSYVP